jgi:hypothetical protein
MSTKVKIQSLTINGFEFEDVNPKQKLFDSVPRLLDMAEPFLPFAMEFLKNHENDSKKRKTKPKAGQNTTES